MVLYHTMALVLFVGFRQWLCYRGTNHVENLWKRGREWTPGTAHGNTATAFAHLCMADHTGMPLLNSVWHDGIRHSNYRARVHAGTETDVGHSHYWETLLQNELRCRNYGKPLPGKHFTPGPYRGAVFGADYYDQQHGAKTAKPQTAQLRVAPAVAVAAITASRKRALIEKVDCTCGQKQKWADEVKRLQAAGQNVGRPSKLFECLVSCEQRVAWEGIKQQKRK